MPSSPSAHNSLNASPSDSTRLAQVADLRPPRNPVVENRVTFGAENSQFVLCDVFCPTKSVSIRPSNLLYCGMISGTKRFYTEDGQAIPFLPAESLVVPPNHTIHIDSPGASEEQPSKCLVIEIARTKVDRVVEFLNDKAPRPPESGEWTHTDASISHFCNPPRLEQTIARLAGLFAEDHPNKDLLIDLGVYELVVRVLRMEAGQLLLEASHERATHDPIAAAVEYAKQRLHEQLTIAQLANVAHMSASTFYRYFRDQFGQTPLAYLTEQRVRRAKRLLAQPRASVSEVAAAVGFASPSHFIRVFSSHIGQTPKQYQLARRNSSAKDDDVVRGRPQ